MRYILSVAIVATLSVCFTVVGQENDTITYLSKAEQIVDEQLAAYNKKDIEGFLKVYSDSVTIHNFPDEFRYQGKDIMRERYSSFFSRSGDLKCTLVNRIVHGHTVIDQERISGTPNGQVITGLAIYTILDEKIVSVHFVKE